jgi:hypothetical protein
MGVTEVQLNGVDELSDWLDDREYYQGAHIMAVIRRQGDQPEGPGPSTYLGLQVTAPADRYGERPVVTSGDGVAFRWPAPQWSADVVGQEPPLGVDISEVGAALGGASEPLPDSEVTEAPVSGRAKDGTDGRQR